MEFGAAVGLDGLVASDPDAKQTLYGTGFFKHRDLPSSEDAADDWRTAINGGSAKAAKLGGDCFSVSAPKAAQMLCFSSSLHKPDSQSPALPCLSYGASIYGNYAGTDASGSVVDSES